MFICYYLGITMFKYRYSLEHYILCYHEHLVMDVEDRDVSGQIYNLHSYFDEGFGYKFAAYFRDMEAQGFKM